VDEFASAKGEFSSAAGSLEPGERNSTEFSFTYELLSSRGVRARQSVQLTFVSPVNLPGERRAAGEMLLREDDGPLFTYYGYVINSSRSFRLGIYRGIYPALAEAEKKRDKSTYDVNALPRCEQDLRTKIT